MQSRESIVQEGVSEALNRLLQATNQAKLVRNLIVDTLRTSKDARTKITAMSVLMSIPMESESSKVLSIIEHQISQNDPDVKAKAIEVLGFFIHRFPTLSKRDDRKQYKRIKSLIYTYFVKLYNVNNPLVVKKQLYKK